MSGSARPRSSVYKKRILGQLNDLALDPQRISSFASSVQTRSKSAKRYVEATQDIKKELQKQAWAPKPLENLSTSSSRFQGQNDTFLQDKLDHLLSKSDEMKVLDYHVVCRCMCSRREVTACWDNCNVYIAYYCTAGRKGSLTNQPLPPCICNASSAV